MIYNTVENIIIFTTLLANHVHSNDRVYDSYINEKRDRYLCLDFEINISDFLNPKNNEPLHITSIIDNLHEKINLNDISSESNKVDGIFIGIDNLLNTLTRIYITEYTSEYLTQIARGYTIDSIINSK